jgi:hypothetical protein
MTYYNHEGNVVDLQTWVKLVEFKASKVRQDTIEGWFISTVFLGTDHGFGGGPPLIFETMIFPPADEPEGGELDHWQDRYPTEYAARAGHDRALAMVRDHLAGAS